jgi:ubiquitin-conjugating enzyme E2 R
MSAVPHLQKQLKELTQHPMAGFRIEVADDLFTWTVWFSGPADTLYFPGQYKGLMTFPQDFPFKPPEFRILSSFWHPNVYDDGKVCISILHAPGTDEMNTIETASMRWTPVQSIDKVLISIISLLGEPDPSEAGAPANVDALSQYRKNRAAFEDKCKKNAEKSLAELPAGWVPPTTKDEKPQMTRDISTFSDNVFMEDDQDLDDEEDAGVPEKEEKKSTPYRDELEQIRGMGVGTDKSDVQIVELLQKYKGDLSRVIDAVC